MHRLAHWLTQQGIPHILTREPGGTPLAERLRHLVVEEEDLTATEELLLLLAARHHHIRTVIQPALDSGVWVLSDRFSDSSLVYQGIVGGLGLDTVLQSFQWSRCTLLPDLTFVFLTPPDIALERRQAKRDTCNKFDRKSATFHALVYRGYETLIHIHPERYSVISGNPTIDQAFATMTQALDSWVAQSQSQPSASPCSGS
jgi:dTMP kinase